MKIEANKKKDAIISVLLVVAIIAGSFSIGNLEVAGVVITYYRLIVPLFFLYYFIVAFRRRSWHEIFENKVWLLGIIIGVVWLIDGVILMLINNELNFSKNGIKELFSLSLGFLVVGVIIVVMKTPKCMAYMFIAIKVLYCMMLLLAIVECVTGWHLNTSQFRDPEQIRNYLELHPGMEKEDVFFFNATAVFYGPNDFAAFLAIFTPLFFLKGDCLWKRILNMVVIFFSLLVIMKNDAWIAFFSLLVGFVIYMILTKPSIWEILAKLCVFFIAYRWGVILFNGLVSKISVKFFPDAAILKVSDLPQSSTVEAVLEAQTANAVQGYGSLYIRINTYLEGIKQTFAETFGAGFGPDGFVSYFSEYFAVPVLINPHCLWIEILSQYGILIFLLYVGYLCYCYIQLIKRYIETRESVTAAIIAIDTIFVFAVFAPSSFLGYGYQWIPIAWTISIAANRWKQNKLIRETVNDIERG